MAKNNGSESVFSRYINRSKGRPPTPINQHAQKLLDWLQHWTEPTIRARDINTYGPRPRNRKNTINSTNILVEKGWLNRLPTHRYDSRKWQIVRKPVIHPTIGNG